MNKILSHTISLAFVSVSFTLSASQELIEKGKYLADAADCYACHTTDDGQQYGGGKAFPLPMGMKIYSTNISSDKTFGIGNYTLEDFTAALREGKSANNGYLYPAMPYGSYALITDDDIKALFAYFQTVPAVKQKKTDNDVYFPANVRTGILGWNMLFLDDKRYLPDSEKSENWNRGNYLVNSFGHCGECHTPRNLFMALEKDKPFQGAVIGSTWAPNITAENLLKAGWGSDDLASLLRHGYSDKGVVTGEMYTVVKHSLSKLSEQDMRAVTGYLLNSDEYIASKTPVYDEKVITHEGYPTYMSYCASCHGDKGQGKPNFAPKMLGNGTLMEPNQYNVVYSIIGGIDSQYYNQVNSFDAMPSYQDKLSDQQLLDLMNYLSASFTFDKKEFTAPEIKALRESVLESLETEH
ncbi:cytochrome c [Psychromonas marina]|uniref:Cytochrome c n=1 Tax=Psychromonas marina TaxID=88364 RepID=A0ABQ6E3D5_9GAMM|nr:c-type cytochrome [Psychromonas marina]GLS91919.1 cytochrome c [Psychromonas marina]